MEDHALAAVAAGAGAAVGAPAAVAAIPVVVAEDLPATHPVTAALAPVPKLFCRRCFAPFDVYPPVFTSYEFLQMSAIDFNFSPPPSFFLSWCPCGWSWYVVVPPPPVLQPFPSVSCSFVPSSPSPLSHSPLSLHLSLPFFCPKVLQK